MMYLVPGIIFVACLLFSTFILVGCVRYKQTLINVKCVLLLVLIFIVHNHNTNHIRAYHYQVQGKEPLRWLLVLLCQKTLRFSEVRVEQQIASCTAHIVSAAVQAGTLTPSHIHTNKQFCAQQQQSLIHCACPLNHFQRMTCRHSSDPAKNR